MNSASQNNANPQKAIKLVTCPTCKKLAAYDTNNLFRPFCSQRCKLIDLGDWANESYRIADNKPLNNDAIGNDNDQN